MPKKLKILHLEDDPDYAELVRVMLEADGLSPEIAWVSDGAAFTAALEQQRFDLVISDYCLPTFNGLQALKLTLEKSPGTPFILVSGTIGEQAAIESLKHGATDYVLKQWLDRLVPAVRRALREAEEHRARIDTEQELIRRERHFRALTENALDVLTLLTAEGDIQQASSSVTRVLGYPPAQLAGASVFELIHPADCPSVRAAFAHGMAHPNETVTVEFRLRHQDGSWRHLESVGQNLMDDPAIRGVLVTSRDVTERKRAEARAQALARLGGRLNSAITQREAALVIADSADELLGWNVFALDLWEGGSHTLTTALAFDDIDGRRTEIPASELPTTPSPMARRVARHGAELVLRDDPAATTPDTVRIGDKARPSASLMFVPIRNGEKLEGVLTIQSYTPRAYASRDLETLQMLADHCSGALERIHAERALRETEKRLSSLFAGSPDAIFVQDFSGQVLDVNPAACRLQGLPREQLVGRNVLDLVPPEARAETQAAFQRLVGGDLQQVEGICFRADGEHVPVEVRASRVEYAGQQALLLHVRDLTERKRTESALRGSELLFYSVWENSVDGMRLTNEEGTIIAVNDAFCRLVGMRREQLEGQPYTVVYAGPENHERLLKKYRQRFRDRVIERQIQRHLVLHNGQVVELEDTNSYVELPGRPPLLLGLFRDLTAQKRLEEQLRQSQKMDAIGQLAGGVAHDFNNILTIIQGHASLLQSGDPLAGPAAKSAQQIGQAAERAAGLTRQLLTFSRRQVMQPRRLDLNEVVSNLTKMLARILGEDITLLLHYWPQPPLVMADASMVEQILLNLAVNARDAMPKGGQLSVHITVADVDARHIEARPEAREGCFVCLSVADTGCGIPQENLRRIFEPFFTTKEVGKGTGLGLATVYGVVKQHQGWIEVDSKINQGTTFRVFLPHCSETASATEPQTSELIVRGGNETILVVEDEENVRELVCSILECHGYSVLQAPSGPAALDVWSQRRDNIDLLLTDLVMPDRMNGRELAERFWQDRPELKVIFTSGYSADVVGKDFVLRHGLNYLQKPYHPQKLALTIREVLDKEGTAN